MFQIRKRWLHVTLIDCKVLKTPVIMNSTCLCWCDRNVNPCSKPVQIQQTDQ